MPAELAQPSLWHAIIHASLVVKLVMALLLGISITSWSMILQRTLFLRHCQQYFADFEEAFWSSDSLHALFQDIDVNKDALSGAAHIFHTGFKEFTQLQHHSNMTMEGVLNSTNRAMRMAQRSEIDELEKHLPFLATVGSTSPYIGLFGTVWGIMSAFQALGNVQSASIAMVAPGISEALITTALGLFAAIPAVIAYNRCTNQVERLISQYDSFQEAFTGILTRETHEPVPNMAMSA